jgi:hypothetical protein
VLNGVKKVVNAVFLVNVIPQNTTVYYQFIKFQYDSPDLRKMIEAKVSPLRSDFETSSTKSWTENGSTMPVEMTGQEFDPDLLDKARLAIAVIMLTLIGFSQILLPYFLIEDS